MCVTGKTEGLKLLHRNWKESWIQWSKVFTSQQTHRAQKQINTNIRLFASHARPQVIQDFWQSVNNLPSNGGEILMMCLRAWDSAQNWSRANISQSTRQFIIQPDIQTATEVSQHTGQSRILTLDYFECFFPFSLLLPQTHI